LLYKNKRKERKVEAIKVISSDFEILLLARYVNTRYIATRYVYTRYVFTRYVFARYFLTRYVAPR